jgi:hypothetical protein
MNAKPGTYVVLITKGAGIGFAPPPTSLPSDEEERTKLLMKGGPTGVPRGVLPAVYADRRTTPFTREIKPGDNQLEPFLLKSKP